MRLLVAGQLVARIFTFSEYLINFIARILPSSSSCPLNAQSECHVSDAEWVEIG